MTESEGIKLDNMNFEKFKKVGKFRITWGYDEDIKFFFRLTKFHGLEIVMFNRLLSVGK